MAKGQERLYRSKQDIIIGGVCGGVGEYLNVDPTWVRLVWALASLGGGFGIVMYLIAWFIIPENPYQKVGGKKKEYDHISKKAKEFETYVKNNNERSAGIILIILGIIFLLNTFYNISIKVLFPVFLIGIGILMLSRNQQK